MKATPRPLSSTTEQLRWLSHIVPSSARPKDRALKELRVRTEDGRLKMVDRRWKDDAQKRADGRMVDKRAIDRRMIDRRMTTEE